jgi:uncharacterized membrane protein
MRTAHRGPIESKLNIKQHPLHPMIVPLPLAFLPSALATDAAFWWLGDPFWAAVSFWLCAAGFASGVLAALVGLADFVQIEEARRHVTGWSHLLVAIAALAVAAANVRLRIEDPPGAILPWGIALSGVLTVLVVFAGWLGGSLTFRHGIGTYWHDLDRAREEEADEPLQQ